MNETTLTHELKDSKAILSRSNIQDMTSRIYRGVEIKIWGVGFGGFN